VEEEVAMDRFHPWMGILRAGSPGDGMATSPRTSGIRSRFLAGLLAVGGLGIGSAARADTTPPAVLDPNLQVTTVVGTGLSQPIGIVFLGSVNDFGSSDFAVRKK
jgi:hypothetical protein